MNDSFPPIRGSVAEMAQAYLAGGWSILPIRPGDKRPLSPALPAGDNGKPSWKPFQERQPTADEVAAWLDEHPGMNLAVATGAVSGVTVVDIDGRAGMASIKALGREFPKTLLQKSPHGWHAFFKHADGVTNGANVLPHVDIRGDGGYVVIAPSTLEDGDYAWLRVQPMVDFPRWILDAEQTEPAKARLEVQSQPRAAVVAQTKSDLPGWISAALRNGAPRGERNHTATRMAGFLHSRGLPNDIIAEILEPFRKACEPEMRRDELQQVIASVGRYHVQARTAGVLKPPLMTDTFLGHRYSWADAGISVLIESVRNERNSYVCEMTVEVDLPGYPSILHGPIKHNLMATTTLSQVVNYLDKRMPANWRDILETVSRLAIEAYRSGEPTIKLRDAVEPDGGQFAIKPLVLADAPTIWFGDGGVGKSVFALAAACDICDGFEILGQRADQTLRVLYLDWEWDAWQHKARLRSLVGEKAMAQSEILYQRCSAPLADMVESLKKTIHEHGVGFVVIDSLIPACGGEPEAADTARTFASAARQLGVGSLWLTHITKATGPEAKKKPIGSAFWHNLARSTWYLEKHEEAGDDDFAVGFYNRKANASRLEKPLGFRVAFAAGGVSVVRTDVASDPVLAEGLPITQQVVSLLEAYGDMDSDAIVAELPGLNDRSVRNALTQLRKSDKIVRYQSGEWGLVKGEEIPEDWA